MTVGPTIDQKSPSGAIIAPDLNKHDPLGTCPPHLKPRYEAMAARAKKGHADPAARLKCLECCAWQSGEVAICHIVECALWARNMKGRGKG